MSVDEPFNVYREQLSSLYHGLALWDPQPVEHLHKQPDHVSIGDVGYLDNGAFIRMFNVTLPWDDSSNRLLGKPEKYELLESIHPDNVRFKRFREGEYYTSHVSKVENIGANTHEDSLGQMYQCRAQHRGAFLFLPHNGLRKDVLPINVFKDYIRDNVENWFRWTKKMKLPVEQMEDLILVTGCTLVTSWAAAAFERHTSVDSSISLEARKSDDGDAQFVWRNIRGLVEYDNSLFDQNVQKPLPLNQCIFIRGFRAKRTFFRTVPMRAAAESLPDDPDDRQEDETQVTRIPDGSTVNFNPFILYEAMGKESLTSYQYRDPLIGVLDYIIQKCNEDNSATEVIVAIAHEDDLRLIEGKETLTADSVEEFLREKQMPLLIRNGAAIILHDPANNETPVPDEMKVDYDTSVSKDPQVALKDFLLQQDFPQVNKLSGVREMFRSDKGEGQHSLSTNIDSPSSQNHELSTVMPIDPVEKVKGMYRLLDLISELGSNGYVEKVVIAQNSIQCFINSISPGSFESSTRVDFETLNRFMIKPFGVYGSKDEIVRLLQEIGAVGDNVASLLRAPAGSSDSQLTLSSGLYIVRANVSDLADERHFVVYWPEDTTWNDSATSSVCHNRITFMRYLAKICDQVIALVSLEHATAIVWSDQDSDAESVDMEPWDTDRLYTFEVAETNVQEENAVACPGFQMNSRYILPSDCSFDCPLDPIALAPRLLPGETTQGFCTVSYVQRQSHSQLEFFVHPMDLTSDEKHSMQSNPDYIPSLAVNERLSSKFHIPLSMKIAFHQILENGKLLLILLDGGRISIYVDHLHAIDSAVRRERPIKNLYREKLGDDVLFAFDESRLSLAVCASTKLKLYMFVFDENYRTLQAQGTAVNLAPWYYSQTDISILHIAFVCGNEEVVLVDSSSQARIFSFVTLQFRPASVQLPSIPGSIFSSPDGSCFLVYHTQGSKPFLTAYHWETFGSTAGVRLDVPEFPLQSAVLTSVVDRGRIFLMGLDINSGTVKSIAIKITKKSTELMFKENGNRNGSNNRTRHTLHNSLLDCHAEVWSRFPVVPPVKRHTLIPSSERQEKSITFIAENHSHPFESYFSDLIQKFERTTRKPTGDELRRIKVSAKGFTAFRDEVVVNSDWDVSRYRIGEWLVDLLCLIPIHIAVCRKNRFVPLAGGVLSSDSDKLSFGWYEPIFQSYLASKPVKVVSSMGQQSVGKSYTLNHLLDTSFAGSDMRTTEGVWMSVIPTDDVLIVALDSEGVDSVERSLQEDTLLVLFNTAISNLVLFRNNFAFSRDISGLFQSFQSSSSVLDPAANQSLFRSTLVIIIKDVVETDKVEITREFSIKFFQEFFQQEQRANFVSRLHRGNLDIIPWPVIESKEFYKLFSILKKRLDSQNTLHLTAGQFLRTIKTLMAKLKANDWGALSQTMTEHHAEHRARTLFN